MDGLQREKPIKIHDLGVPLFLETPICHSFATTFWCVHAENVDLFSRFIFEGVMIHWAVLIVMSKWETDDHFPDPKWRANEQ